MEIKVRAWDKENKKMLNPDAIWLKHQEISIEGCFYKNVNLMLFTGLTDINSKEIYEGDIISSFYDKWIVSFGNGSFYLKNPITSSYMDLSSEIINWYDLEVIGNMGKPKLIKGRQKCRKVTEYLQSLRPI